MNKIRRTRRDLGWSQYMLSQKSGVSRNSIALEEQGYIPLKKEDREKIEKAMRKEIKTRGL